MPSLLTSAVNHLTAALDGNTSVDAVYSRTVAGVVRSVSLPLSPADPAYRELDVGTFAEAHQSLDFIATKSRLVLPVVGATLPTRGDRIACTLGGDSHTFEVMAPEGEDCFALDSTRQKLRIHTKRVA